MSDTQERPVSQLVKRDCKCWHAAFLRIMADGATNLNDRDDAERLWPETRDKLRDIAESLVAANDQIAELKACAPKVAADAVTEQAVIEATNNFDAHYALVERHGLAGRREAMSLALDAFVASLQTTPVQVSDEVVRRLVVRQGRSPENAYAMKLARKDLEAALATPRGES